MSENYFNSLRKYLKDCTASSDHELLVKMDNLYSSIFLLSKKGEFDEAERALKLADDDYNQLVISTEIKDHVNILRLPIVAYLFFKLGDFGKAETLLEQSVEASHNLEKIKESFFLKMFRVQQYHNDARIYFKKKTYDTWSLKMKKRIDQLLNYNLTLKGEEISVYVLMVDQLISEVIKFSDIIKEEKYLHRLLKDIKFKHPLFETNDTLRSIKSWCIVVSKVHEFEIDFIYAHQHIESVLYDDTLKEIYKTSLLKSIAPYTTDEEFLSYLNSLKTGMSRVAS
jgi:tetratricopeptide (TPR) repeat protein